MRVRTDCLDEEIRLTVDAATEIADTLADAPDDVTARLRAVLVTPEFVRAHDANDAEIQAFAERAVPIARTPTTLPADQSEHLFDDTTKNRSRRLRSDPRCAGRTHTAARRARVARES
jgi:hypothetical protein